MGLLQNEPSVTDARSDNRPGCRIDKRAACRYELILQQALNNLEEAGPSGRAAPAPPAQATDASTRMRRVGRRRAPSTSALPCRRYLPPNRRPPPKGGSHERGDP